MSNETASQIKAMRESIVSSLIWLYNATNNEDLAKTSVDVRAEFGSALDSVLETIALDPTCWYNAKDKMFYDEYLKSRTEEGTLTDLDLCREGLVSGQFSHPDEYHHHCIRISENRSRGGLPSHSDGTKICAVCGKEKSRDKFKKRGGATCSACHSRNYRERKNEV